MKRLHPTFFLLVRDSEPVSLMNALDDYLERPSPGLERRLRLPLSSTFELGA